MTLVDTHCHLQDEAFDDTRGAVLERAFDIVDWLVLSSDTIEASRRALSLTNNRIFTAVGVHPYHAGDVDAATLDSLRALAQAPGAVAIGEIGLDYYHYCDTPRNVQFAAFESQLNLACELNLPVTIHNRDAHDDCLAMLAQFANRLPACVLHCFSGDAEYAERCLEHERFYLSFAGNVTYPKAQILRDAAAVTPLDRLLVETDSPYLSPQPVRKQRPCEPAFVQYTAAALAQIKAVSIGRIAECTTANAERVFRTQRSTIITRAANT